MHINFKAFCTIGALLFANNAFAGMAFSRHVKPLLSEDCPVLVLCEYAASRDILKDFRIIPDVTRDDQWNYVVKFRDRIYNMSLSCPQKEAANRIAEYIYNDLKAHEGKPDTEWSFNEIVRKYGD